VQRRRIASLRLPAQPVDAPAPSLLPRPQAHEEGHGLFDWARQWYPVSLVDDLHIDRLQSFTVLGKALVVWRDGAGEWRAFQNRCPHRGVPLSQGRLEADGTLACGYHGWRFKGLPRMSRRGSVKRQLAYEEAATAQFAACLSHPHVALSCPRVRLASAESLPEAHHWRNYNADAHGRQT
jgi:hypothetical protein